ncbi:DUF2690 domain-containing protein [Streptomyces sudanensis]|uniref:DUF2690 domain-containing protein n=1 Tax=Streptomyces sudanensis TaxID=436397 RepID=UPI0020CD90CB|nr:DUF2690 domain-containing protein [Streptomyces sudanensis]MCP9957644.1 DUF2690 domain-containing protein [Streptomyces sudanensis]
MPRWKALPGELDPPVREFVDALRGLVDRGGLDPDALAARTGYGRDSWERYLDGRSLAPADAVLALADATGTDPVPLATLRELAEQARSRAGKRGGRPAGAAPGPRTPGPRTPSGAPAVPYGSEVRTAPGPRTPGPRAPSGAPAVPYGSGPRAPGARTPSGLPYGSEVRTTPGPRAPGSPAPGVRRDRPRTGAPAPASVPVPRGVNGAPGAAARPPGSPVRQAGLTVAMFFAGALGTLLVFAAAMLLPGLGGDRAAGPVAAPAGTAAPAAPAPSPPVGVGCHRGACEGQDPHAMGCGGSYGSTIASTVVGTVLVEVRHSSACGAAWARVSGAAPGDTVEVTAAGTVRSAAVGADGDAYTPMVVAPAGAAASACARLRDGTTGCTAAP